MVETPCPHLKNTRGSHSMATWGMQRPVPPQLYHSWSALSRNMKPLHAKIGTAYFTGYRA
jgi:hypothetical protein